MSNRANLLKDIEELVKEVEKTHRYSMSRIYGLWNEVFGRNEKPQSCASCLLRKVGELKRWLDEEKAKQEVVEVGTEMLEQDPVRDVAEQLSEETEAEKPVKKRGRKKKEEK